MGEVVSEVPAYVCEFVGTFLLVFTVGCNVLTGQAVWGVTSIACCLMVSIYAMGGISGGNFNPAVTFALWLLGKMCSKKAGIYMMVQIAGGIAGGLAYAALFWEVFNLQPSPGYGFLQTMCAEMTYTFMLVFVVLNVAYSKFHDVEKGNDKNQFYGLAIGFCVVAGGYGAGHISGGCFNPAVALGIDISSAALGLGWCFVYAVFEFAGAALAVVAFWACRPEERDQSAEFDAKNPGYGLSQKLASEFIGTYFLVLTVGLNVIGGSKAPVWSIGSSLMCMIFALGSVSGAHFNPAVTIAVRLSGRNQISTSDAGAYIGIQLLAGICAGLSYGKMTAHFGEWFKSFPLDPGAGYGWFEAAFAEIAFTFLLAYVVLAVATVEKPLSEYLGLAIGACVIAGGTAIGAVSGGSLNPAVSWGISSSHILRGGHFWHCLVYSLFEIMGGVLAAGVFALTHTQEYKKENE